MRTPNYVLTESHNVSLNNHDSRHLEEGSFVRPLEMIYVPQHVIDAHKWFNVKNEIFCYTHFGIIAIPKYKVRAT